MYGTEAERGDITEKPERGAHVSRCRRSCAADSDTLESLSLLDGANDRIK